MSSSAASCMRKRLKSSSSPSSPPSSSAGRPGSMITMEPSAAAAVGPSDLKPCDDSGTPELSIPPIGWLPSSLVPPQPPFTRSASATMELRISRRQVRSSGTVRPAALNLAQTAASASVATILCSHGRRSCPAAATRSSMTAGSSMSSSPPSLSAWEG